MRFKSQQELQSGLGSSLSSLCSWHGANDITVSRVSDAQGANPEILSTRCTKLVVVASVVMDSSLGQHSVILNLRLSISEGLQSLLIAKAILPRLHNKRQTGVDR